MPRLTTRIKRKLYITTSRRGKKNITKKNGPKTFSTKERAEEYAKAQKLAKYTVESAKKNKRFKIVAA